MASPNPLSAEEQPLLPKVEVDNCPKPKPILRPRQLWVIWVIFTASLVRGMTLASRVKVYTQLACQDVQWKNNTRTDNPFFLDESSMLSDALAPPRILDWVDASTARCTDDPAVQSSAAKIQALFITTTGLLSVITTAYWGQKSERVGRLRVVGTATFGLLLTDLVFTIISHPALPFVQKNIFAHRLARVLLVLTPAIEGSLGGWSTLQSGLTAYTSDCTSAGSRSHVFSRLLGCMFLGVSVGPAIGSWIAVRYQGPNPFGEGAEFTLVFFVAAMCSMFNLFLVTFVFPESLTQEKMDCAKARHAAPSGPTTSRNIIFNSVASLAKPLQVFLPAKVPHHHGQDWNLTLLALACFLFMLSTGIYQLKYLYGEHVYGWGTEALSFFVTFISGSRAIYTIFIFPLIVRTFKPKFMEDKPVQQVSDNALEPSSDPHSEQPVSQKCISARTLARETRFDLLLAKCGLFLDALSNLLICLTPLPPTFHHGNGLASDASGTLFFVSSAVATLGSGSQPVIPSLALSLVKAREVVGFDCPLNKDGLTKGQVLGAVAVLQAAGQMIVGPALFGLVYSSTVAKYPQGIFAVCGVILACALFLVALIRPLPALERGCGESDAIIENGQDEVPSE
ncbi:hypothetical protein DL96DRAFT_1534941 [Flagelloscypha sp. PMI_526]|nr:hypothetical protein DL96DRAFT_1534941 [Flagelloscypha sp. PMI_526]